MDKLITKKYNEYLPIVRKMVDDCKMPVNINHNDNEVRINAVSYDHKQWVKRKRQLSQNDRFFTKHAENIALAALIASVIYLNTLVEYILF